MCDKFIQLHISLILIAESCGYVSMLEKCTQIVCIMEPSTYVTQKQKKKCF